MAFQAGPDRTASRLEFTRMKIEITGGARILYSAAIGRGVGDAASAPATSSSHRADHARYDKRKSEAATPMINCLLSTSNRK